MLITNIVGEAYRMRMFPSDVWARYEENPRDLQQLWAYGPWLEERRKQLEKQSRRGR